MGKEADGGSMDGREHDMKKGLFSIFYNMALFLYKRPVHGDCLCFLPGR